MPSQSTRVTSLVFVKVIVLLLASSAAASLCPTYQQIQSDLGRRLSSGSSIDNSASSTPRWSLYGAPKPVYVVHVAAESDVSTTVQYCNKENVTFLAQNGGNGWANTFNLGRCGLVIDISGLRKITFNAQRTQATIQGGVRVQEMVDAAYGNDTRFATPTCNCLGFLGASLGGGLTRTSGLYGWAVDQVLSVTVVLASGAVLQVSDRSHPDLFWALRGAAPNFGIVTSAVVRAYPVPATQNVAWQGPLAFADDQLEDVVRAVDALKLAPNMQIDILIGTSGAPMYTPTITVLPLFVGNASAGRDAFASILQLGPTSDGTAEIPYNQWSAFADGFCTRGDRKPTYGVSADRLEPSTWRAVFEQFKALVASDPAAFAQSSILAEKYNVDKAVAIGNATSSFPFRDVTLHIVAIPWYADARLDATAERFGTKVRSLLQADDGLARDSTYINFAHGDESLPTIYGTSLPDLQYLKKKYDPLGRFSQWFPLS